MKPVREEGLNPRLGKKDQDGKKSVAVHMASLPDNRPKTCY